MSPESDALPRSRRGKKRTESTQAGQELDWTGFNLKRAIQLLGSHDERILRRTIRTLHLRFSHCSAEKLRNILVTAGVEGPALRMVQQVVDTDVNGHEVQ